MIFANTDEVPAPESKKGELIENNVEAMFIFQTVESLILSGMVETSIGIISPYRAQLKIISYLLKNRPGIEILTVDKFQGRDKSCILVSLVRSNQNQNVNAKKYSKLIY